MRHLSLVPLAALALAACQQAEAPSAGEDPRTGAASPAPAAQPPAAVAIPAALHGRWGLVPADCTSTRGDAKGLVTIDATTLRFYESRAQLGAVRQRDDNGIEASFAFSGEGQTWRLDVDLRVKDGGKTMLRRDKGPDAAAQPLRYARCA